MTDQKKVAEIWFRNIELREATRELPEFSSAARRAILQAAAQIADDGGGRQATTGLSRRWSGKSLVVAALLLVLTLGTVFALSQSYERSIWSYFTGEQAERLVPDSLLATPAASNEGITFVVDGIVPLETEYLIVASLHKETAGRWEERIVGLNRNSLYVRVGEETVPSIWTIGDAQLTEDGRRLTLQINWPYTNDMQPELGRELNVGVEHLLVPEPTTEFAVQLPLAELYERNGVHQIYRRSSEYNNSLSPVYEALAEPTGGELIPVAEYPDISLLGVGLASLAGEDDPSTLFLFTFNSEDHLPDGGIQGRRGIATEITNLRTGEVIEWEQSPAIRPHNYFRYADAETVIGYSRFAGHIKPEELADWAVTKMAYFGETRLIGPWEVSLSPDRHITKKTVAYTGTMTVAKIDRTHWRGRDDRSYDITAQVEGTLSLTSLEIILAGRVTAVPENAGKADGDPLYKDPVLYGEMYAVRKDGTQIPLEVSRPANLREGSWEFVEVYRYERDYEAEDLVRTYRVIDPEEVDYIVLEGKKIYF